MLILGKADIFFGIPVGEYASKIGVERRFRGCCCQVESLKSIRKLDYRVFRGKRYNFA